MPGTRIPTGHNRVVSWQYPQSEAAAVKQRKDLLESSTNCDLVRVTVIAVYQSGEAWKFTTTAPDDRYHWFYDRQWLYGYPQRTAAIAILPKEVLDEATR